MPLSLDAQFEAVNIVTQFGRLFALDRVRTDYLERVEQPITRSSVDVEFMSRLIYEMQRLLEDAVERATYLRLIIEEYNEELEDSFSRILWLDALTGDQKVRLDLVVRRYGSVGEYGMMGAEGVSVGAAPEIEALETEMDAIHRDDLAAGDLSSGFLCNMGAACIVGGLFAPPPTNIVGVSVGLLMIGQVYAMGEEC